MTSVSSFGFRGEALSSLCAVGNVTVITSQESEAPVGTKLELNTHGRIKSKTSVARERGTTIIINDFFKSLPVRQRELKKNIKREFAKCLDLIQAYALISDGVRISCSNQGSKG